MITALTRRDLVDLILRYDPAPTMSLLEEVNGYRRRIGIDWWGRMGDDVSFLARLYDLDALPSSDDRFKTAAEDIWQHRENNDDWDNDWIFFDERFELANSDEKLLRFLAETLHPEVRSDRTEVDLIRAEYNRILRPDRVEIRQVASMSGRPVFGGGVAAPRNIQAQTLRDAIGQVIRNAMSAGKVEAFCDELRMPTLPEGSYAVPKSSKAGYVVDRLEECPVSELVRFARIVHDRFADPELGDLLAEIDWAGRPGVAGAPKNLIFGAGERKPDLVLADAVNNDIQIVRNAEHCLIYDRPINSDAGVSFEMLVDWWAAAHPSPDGGKPENDLYKRLLRGQNDPERAIFGAYASLLLEHGFGLPALVPQVYLHYDPETVDQRNRISGKVLSRQRMDFLMLLPGRHRVVIELDGRHHYTDEAGSPSPRRYAEMMAEDRRLRLAGYEVYRIGGYEFVDLDAGRASARAFFAELLRRHSLLPA
ncbi:hypothetical protein ACE2AJ_18730 [Aquihabitans daechungensis]|uniref:AbiJ-related protein n=1 Tax=Aquihabitans daechungensis TaxID=1052257 RepID=UPI003BA02BE4